MADFVFRVNGRELADYVRVAHDEGWDPIDPDAVEPQFSGAPAFVEGAAFTQDASGNREWQIPLHLRASSQDGLYQLIRDIQGELDQGVQVELKMPSAASSTFFDLESGRLEVEWQYWIARASRVRAVLRLWTRGPHGHTGTARTVASLSAAGPTYFSVTGILGDVDAFAKLEVRVGSKVASGGRVVGYGVHRSASFLPYRGPSSADFVAQSGATVRGASGAIGSQYLAIPVSPTGASGVALRSFLTPPGGHVGRHRVLGVMRSRLNRPITLYARDRFGAPLGPTTAASVTDQTRWGLVDLGEIQVPVRDTRQEAVPTQLVELIGGGASGAKINASPALELNRLIYLPLDEAPVLLRTRGADGSLLFGDSFDRLELGTRLDSMPGGDRGGVWSRVAGYFYGAKDERDGLISAGNASTVDTGATALYSLGSGARLTNVEAEALVSLHPDVASAAATGAEMELWVKGQAPSGAATSGVRAKLVLGPSANHHLALISKVEAAATVLHASAALGGSSASGLYAGQAMRLVVRTVGNLTDVWLATGALSPTPILSATHANFAIDGYPMLGAREGPLGRGMWIRDVTWGDPAVGASDIGAREYFRFESHPERRVIQANASVYVADRIGEFRGDPPTLPPVGSPGASGPAQVVVFAGDPSDFLGNDVMDVRVDVVERFRFLR